MGEKSLLFIWQDPKTHLYFHVGTLSYDGNIYKFEYTHQSKAERRVHDAIKHGYILHPIFPELEKEYASKKLFSTFARRIPSKNRIDYADVLKELSLPNDADKMDLLRATRGVSGKNPYSFDEPLRLIKENVLFNHFYINGMRHKNLPENWHTLIQIGEKLKLEPEPNNEFDANAVKILTQNNVHLGYVPGVYAKAINALLERGLTTEIIVTNINLDQAPQNWVKVSFKSILDQKDSTATIIELEGLVTPAA